jgi:hypothetical protein
MSDFLDSIPLTDLDLKNAMGDPRYWDPGNPERAGFHDWVTKGWEALYPANGERPAGGTAWVRPYTRMQDGKTVQVSGYQRASTGGKAAARMMGPQATPVVAPALPLMLGGLLGLGTALGVFGTLNRQRAEGQGQRGGKAETPVLVLPSLRGARNPAAGAAEAARAKVEELNEEELRDACPKTEEFGDMLRRIAAGIPREGRSAQQWGTEVHMAMKQEIIRKYGEAAGQSSDPRIRAEISFLEGEPDIKYGRLGSTRLDIFHHVEGTNDICIYDIKTGARGLTEDQAKRAIEEATKFALKEGIVAPKIYIVELRP